MKQFSIFLNKHKIVLNKVISKCSVITTDKFDNGEICPILTCADKNTIYLQSSSSIGIHFSYAKEHIPTIELIKSDNKCLNKTIAVFVELCMEVRELCKEGNLLLIKCVFNKKESRINQYETDISLSVDVINEISSLFGCLLQALQFVERCYIVVSEIIKQFAALFDVKFSNNINVDYSSLHFQVSCLHIQ